MFYLSPLLPPSLIRNVRLLEQAHITSIITVDPRFEYKLFQ